MITCMRSLIRSRGAVTLLAAAPATAPAANSETSLGTKATKASGCLKNWATVGKDVGCNSFWHPLSATETEAKLQDKLLNPFSLHCNCGSGGGTEFPTRPVLEASRPGIVRQTKTPFSSLISTQLSPVISRVLERKNSKIRHQELLPLQTKRSWKLPSGFIFASLYH